MQLSRRPSAAFVIAGLVALVGGGMAAAQTMAPIGSGDVVADRQRLMKLNGASLKDLTDKLKAGQIEAMAVNAETLALNAQHITVLFPKGSKTDKSYAKPEIWDRWAEFEGSAKAMEKLAMAVRDAAAAKDAAATQAAMQDFGRKACGSCHTPFRTPRS
jgi:cytochrome c556